MTTVSYIRANLLPSLGLVLPPLFWAANTEAGQILPYSECGGLKYTGMTSIGAAALSLFAGFVSWRTVRHNPSDAALGVTSYPISFRFVGLLSGLNGALFAFALLLQGLSSVVLTACER